MKLKTFEDTNYQNQEERGNTITDPTEIKRIIMEYYKQLCPNKLDNFYERGKFLERCKFLERHRYPKTIENLNRPIPTKGNELII